MSYAEISTQSFDLLPVLIDLRRHQSAAQPGAGASRTAPRPRRYQAIERLDSALYLSLAGGFAVMVYGFLSMLH